MRVIVTGASGFLGTAVVRRAVEAGHDVVALVRPVASLRDEVWSHPAITVVRGDLRQRGDWTDELGRGADAVIHLAASVSGDLAGQLQGTVIATESLLAALGPVGRFVHISTFSVYDYSATRQGSVLDESSPIERDPATRDGYTTTKLIQERLVRDACAGRGCELVVIRPGAIYGPGMDWDFGLALRMPGNIGLMFAPRSRMRLTYVTNCASAIVAALTAPRAAGATLNIVDDHDPTRAQYARACRAAGGAVPRVVPVPWILVRAFGRLIAFGDRRWAGGNAKLPEFAALRRQEAQWKPLVYANDHAKEILGWTPSVSLADAVAMTVADR